MTETSAKRELLLVGSVGLDTAEEVFRAVAGILPGRVRAIPDGETGPRAVWVIWNRDVFTAHPAFEVDPPEEAAGGRVTSATEGMRKWGGGDQLEQGKPPPPRLRVRDSVDPATIAFGPLGYVEVAIESWATFKRLRGEGVIPAETRFQVSLPTTAASMNAHIVPEHHHLVEEALTRRVLAEAAQICDAIPHRDLALQWDVSTEMGQVEEVRFHWFENALEGAMDRLARHCAAVPEDVTLGIHLCYGSYGNRHWKEPDDLANCVAVFNTLLGKVSRSIGWVHLPVPIERDDEDYYAPLRNLNLPEETKLYLGLIHLRDGVDGTRRRMAVADRFVTDYGIATECGFGRRPPETIPDLLRIHAEA